MGIPEELGVVVGVDVDEAGSDHEATGVDGATGALVDLAHGDDAAVAHADVGHPPWRSRPVDQRAALDENVEHVRLLGRAAPA